MITIGIVDDHSLIISGLAHMLSDQPDCPILFTAGNGKQLVAELERQLPDVLLLDIELPDSNGIELCAEILKKYPALPIIALTNHDEVVYVRKMIRSGAKGYLLKGTDKQNLLNAIQAVYNGQQFLDRQIEQAILQQAISGKRPSTIIKLTKRENEILALIANEYSNQEIADKLFLSVRTVESHRHSLNQKLNIKNPAGLVKEAYLRGLI
ncbi:response regulator transcription factor [Parapedobacter sp. ISTM3]|jgi:Response regulator containing a CheY-like receiver domain and an HTH DNA-binding domain|uniref:Two component transcriptional regulator, LuxR family n=1 Tax=Parapedobacter luteus TaxID=623280 RepID=A0A1T5EDE7_9SPHI|nr:MULTISPECIES: response regulator transcription factor [Parapedobacter]MBK1441182.1 response regulator transcription factor [Parapedobacter sp. ISTM3]SKB82042.1 two component transcriptional regulator, LuxR family [Parapedobacter luteus]